MTDIIATRSYELHAESGMREVELRIHRPEPLDAPQGDFRCRVEVLGLSQKAEQYAYGVDAVQALVLGLALARMYVTMPGLREDSRLTWLGQDDPGIPNVLPERPSE